MNQATKDWHGMWADGETQGKAETRARAKNSNAEGPWPCQSRGETWSKDLMGRVVPGSEPSCRPQKIAGRLF